MNFYQIYLLVLKFKWLLWEIIWNYSSICTQLLMKSPVVREFVNMTKWFPQEARLLTKCIFPPKRGKRKAVLKYLSNSGDFTPWNVPVSTIRERNGTSRKASSANWEHDLTNLDCVISYAVGSSCHENYKNYSFYHFSTCSRFVK